ncbi:hypothetical protein [Neoaquamicrobium sediminum]|nr:hypothetical protein [Mesorhizobium sediminum]
MAELNPGVEIDVLDFRKSAPFHRYALDVTVSAPHSSRVRQSP